MIFIPDIFGSLQKGREAAIEANWKDLQNYESIENSRHQNDAAALTNLATMADFGVRRQMVQNEGTDSDLKTELNECSQLGKLYNADSDNLVAGINRGTLVANEDKVKELAADNLTTLWNNAQTGVYNSGTSKLNASTGYGVTENNYKDALNAANASYKAGIDIQLITAQYGPETAKLALDLQLKEGYVNQEKYNQEMTRLNAIAPYVGPTAAANAKAGHMTAQNNVGQAGINGNVINQQGKTLELTNQLVHLTQAYQTEVALAGPNTKRATDLAKRISEVQTKLTQAAGVTGSIAPYTPTSVPVVDPNTGVYLGSMDPATGAVTRASTTGTPATTGNLFPATTGNLVPATTGNLVPASPLVRTPSQIAADYIGRNTVMTGTPLISLNPKSK